MRNHAILCVAVFLSILTLATTAEAKNRLWVAKQAAQEHAGERIDDNGYAASQVTAENDIKGQRLWEARQQAREKAGTVGLSYGIAGWQQTGSPGSNQGSDPDQLVCETVPGFKPFMVRHYGEASETSENCS